MINTVPKNAIVKELVPLGNHCFITDLETGQQNVGGLIMTNDNMKKRGIRPRKAVVYKVGPDVTDIAPGDTILCAHGMWGHEFPVFDNGKQIMVRYLDHDRGLVGKL